MLIIEIEIQFYVLEVQFTFIKNVTGYFLQKIFFALVAMSVDYILYVDYGYVPAIY